VSRIQEADVDALSALFEAWRTGEPEAIAWAATLCDRIVRPFELDGVSADFRERTSALRVVAEASGALLQIREHAKRAQSSGDNARSLELNAIGARLEAAARTLLRRDAQGGSR
jgi:hypothetical protein